MTAFRGIMDLTEIARVILTIVIIIKNDEFLPGIFCDHSQDDIIQVDRRADR